MTTNRNNNDDRRDGDSNSTSELGRTGQPSMPDDLQEEFDYTMELLEDAMGGVVNHSDAVRLEVKRFDQDVAIRVHVHPDDVGFALGKGGQLARAFQEVFRAIFGKLGFRLTLHVVNPRRDRDHARDMSSDSSPAGAGRRGLAGLGRKGRPR